MERVVYVEVLNRRGRVKNRIKLERFPATIGRDYSNDVILDDRHVCPRHLRVSSDDNGNLVAEDLSSVNGLYLFPSGNRESTVYIKPDMQLRAGNTVLRFRGPGYKVPDTIVHTDKYGIWHRMFEQRLSAAAIVFLSVIFLTFDFYMGSYEKITMTKLVGSSLLSFSLLTIWAAVWSLINRIVSYAFRFHSHLAFAALASVGFSVLFEFTEYYSFLFSPGISLDIMETAGFAILSASVLFGHLSIVSAMTRVRRAVSSIVASVGIVSALLFIHYVTYSEFSNKIDSPII